MERKERRKIQMVEKEREERTKTERERIGGRGEGEERHREGGEEDVWWCWWSDLWMAAPHMEEMEA